MLRTPQSIALTIRQSFSHRGLHRIVHKKSKLSTGSTCHRKNLAKNWTARGERNIAEDVCEGTSFSQGRSIACSLSRWSEIICRPCKKGSIWKVGQVRGDERGQKGRGRDGGWGKSGSFLRCMHEPSMVDDRSACRPVWLALAVTSNTYVGSLKFIGAVAWHVVSSSRTTGVLVP